MEPIQELLDASSDDEQTLSVPVAGRIFGFHAQQAIEKLLKAWIVGTGTNHEYTHDLDILARTVTTLGETMPTLTFPISELTDFGVLFRYTAPRDLSADEREQIRDTVRILREHVHVRLAALNA
jgi:HEPN domain-containing protein